MTNFELYKEDILKIAEGYSSPAMKDGVIVPCVRLSCRECDFGDVGNCIVYRFNWLFEGNNRCNEDDHNYTSGLKKTRQDEFLKHYPNAMKRDSDGVLNVCPKSLDMRFDCKFAEGCDICCQNYWLQEVE